MRIAPAISMRRRPIRSARVVRYSETTISPASVSVSSRPVCAVVYERFPEPARRSAQFVVGEIQIRLELKSRRCARVARAGITMRDKYGSFMRGVPSGQEEIRTSGLGF